MRLRSEIGSLRIDKRELENQREEIQKLRDELQKAQADLRAALTESRAAAMKGLCIFSLKQIEAAREQWAIENKKVAGAPTAGLENAINAFLPKKPRCPESGIHTYGLIGTKPTCSLGISAGHTL